MKSEHLKATGKQTKAAPHPEDELGRPISQTAPPPRGSSDTNTVFPIVGIGASAGGLEALEQFLKHVPGKSGMAFVVVQHLDPSHEGMLPDLLQRATGMPVVQAKNRMKVE